MAVVWLDFEGKVIQTTMKHVISGEDDTASRTERWSNQDQTPPGVCLLAHLSKMPYFLVFQGTRLWRSGLEPQRGDRFDRSLQKLEPGCQGVLGCARVCCPVTCLWQPAMRFPLAWNTARASTRTQGPRRRLRHDPRDFKKDRVWSSKSKMVCMKDEDFTLFDSVELSWSLGLAFEKPWLISRKHPATT